jgi:hypothetical protein
VRGILRHADDLHVDLGAIPTDALANRVSVREVALRQCFVGTIAIVAEPGGSALTITEDGWVANPIFRFLSRFVFGHHATMDGILKQVAKALNEEPALSGE